MQGCLRVGGAEPCCGRGRGQRLGRAGAERNFRGSADSGVAEAQCVRELRLLVRRQRVGLQQTRIDHAVIWFVRGQVNTADNFERHAGSRQLGDAHRLKSKQATVVHERTDEVDLKVIGWIQ